MILGTASNTHIPILSTDPGLVATAAISTVTCLLAFIMLSSRDLLTVLRFL